MDDEMIERVSKAILETPNASDYNRLVAINAIKAMSWPTDKMLEAGRDVGPDRSPEEYWTAMIDAVIND